MFFFILMKKVIKLRDKNSGAKGLSKRLQALAESHLVLYLNSIKSTEKYIIEITNKYILLFFGSICRSRIVANACYLFLCNL